MMWLSIPFITLILLIAIGPLFFAQFWERYYKIIAVLLGIGVVSYYLLVLKDGCTPENTLFDYFSFVSFLSALYLVSGGIYIKVDVKSTPFTNVLLLLFGVLLSNILGTTGASILLIRPFLRLNRHRMRPYLVVFFIFLVCNVGGSLTPLGDPPLFFGFLKGVPFTWTFIHLGVVWVFALSALLSIFFFIDSKNKKMLFSEEKHSGEIKIEGYKNGIWLLLIVSALFLDPLKIPDLPSINGHSFVRELLILTIGFVAYKNSSKEALYHNRFHWGPILEITFLFFGIFFTMMPAIQWLENYTYFNQGNTRLLSPTLLYWGTGVTSSFLDNVPSYRAFLTMATSYFGSSVDDFSMLQSRCLKAISIGAVFFGAMTYIGNAPNFMVKAIAEDMKVKMPSFLSYIFKYSVCYLLPILVAIWILFIY